MFVDICFMAQDMIYLGKCCMNIWKECLFCCCWIKLVLYECEFDVVGWWYWFFYILADFLSSYSIKRGILTSTTVWVCLFLLSCLSDSFLLFVHLFCSSAVWDIYNYDCYVFLVGWPFHWLFNILRCPW